MIDVIYPIVKFGSRCNDLELLFSLRSVGKHLKDYRNIIIIGHLPEFINPETVVHIPFSDGSKKQANIRKKIITAFSDEMTTDEILFMNDDVFILSDEFTATNYPYLCFGDLSDCPEKAARHFARNELVNHNLPTLFFDGHQPIRFKRDLFVESANHYSDEASVKSTYCNHWRINGTEHKDLKINSNLSYHRIIQEISGRAYFSVGDHGMNAPMKKVLQELFPSKSKYEL